MNKEDYIGKQFELFRKGKIIESFRIKHVKVLFEKINKFKTIKHTMVSPDGDMWFILDDKNKLR